MVELKYTMPWLKRAVLCSKKYEGKTISLHSLFQFWLLKTLLENMLVLQCFPEHSSFHLGGNLYLIAEQDGILLTDKNTMSDIYFPLVRWVQLQTTWGYIDDAVHYLEHNKYTSLDVHPGANVFVTAESPVLHLNIRHYYWMNDKRHPSSHGVALDFDQYQKLKDVDRVVPDIVPDLKKTLPCQLTHQNVDSAMYCSECNPCCI